VSIAGLDFNFFPEAPRAARLTTPQHSSIRNGHSRALPAQFHHMNAHRLTGFLNFRKTQFDWLSPQSVQAAPSMVVVPPRSSDGPRTNVKNFP